MLSLIDGETPRWIRTLDTLSCKIRLTQQHNFQVQQERIMIEIFAIPAFSCRTKVDSFDNSGEAYKQYKRRDWHSKSESH